MAIHESEELKRGNSIFFLLRMKMDRFSENHKKIAEMILNNYAQVVNMSSRDMAKALGISPSTVVRFAGELGYESYPKMLEHLRGTLLNLSQSPMQQISETISHAEPLETLLVKVVQQEISCLYPRRFEEMNAAFCRTVEFMGRARRIFITGARSSLALARYAGYVLGNFSKNVVFFPSSVDDRYDRLEDLDDGDIVICISFHRYYKDTVDIARFAQKAGAFVAGITDFQLSPIIPFCTEVMLTPSDTPFISYVPTMVLLDALALAFTQTKEGVREHIDRRSEILLAQNIYEDIL